MKKGLWILGLALCLGWADAPEANAADVLDGYAPPLAFGPSYSLRGHLGPKTYTVSYTAVGKTLVIGEVTYVNQDGRWVTTQFNGSITFRTGNAAAAPSVRFKGVPTGSAVRVSVD